MEKQILQTLLSIEETERVKYEFIFAMGSMRKHSPGFRCATRIFERAIMHPGESLVDLGCGPGRAMLIFDFLGMSVIGVDVASNSLDALVQLKVHDGQIRFIRGAAWRLHELIEPVDWVYCVDVLEHIPEALIERTLEAIKQTARIGTILGISNAPDKTMRKRGFETNWCHPTLKPFSWWREKINAAGLKILTEEPGDRFPKVIEPEMEGTRLFYTRERQAGAQHDHFYSHTPDRGDDFD